MGRIVDGICAGWLAFAAASAAPAEAVEAEGSAGFETDAPYSSCLVYPFPIGSAEIKKDEIRQSPPGCFDNLGRAVQRSEVRLLILSGRSHSHDRQKTSRDPNWRAALGVERARELLALLPKPAMKLEAVLLASGPYHTPSTPETCELERSVEIRAYWREAKASAGGGAPKKEGGLFFRGEMEPDVAVSVLSLLVALSAYLAAVRLFLQERLGGFKDQGARDEGKIRSKLRWLSAPDSLLIGAAVFLAGYVFFSPEPWLVRLAVGLALLGGGALVVLHAFEWIKSWTKSSKGKETAAEEKA